jgi:hypothetical protein
MTTKQNPGHLSKRQYAVIDDLIKNGLNEYEILEKYKISPCRYKKWLENELFTKQLEACAKAVRRQRTFALIHLEIKVVEKLAKMVKDEKGETARKACHDLLELRRADFAKQKMGDRVLQYIAI